MSNAPLLDFLAPATRAVSALRSPPVPSPANLSHGRLKSTYCSPGLLCRSNLILSERKVLSGFTFCLWCHCEGRSPLPSPPSTARTPCTTSNCPSSAPCTTSCMRSAHYGPSLLPAPISSPARAVRASLV
ncbi:hypothetical protein B0H10DRAFT_2440477 [Mycena sp. CBHHK59/15]|nr:hypothetical protein B0H10DRAFT_2440477 [Mycena sp. CBHHK59/15]